MRVEGVAAHRPRITLRQPLEKRGLGGRNHRPDRPQGVVQIETDHARHAHVLILLRLRLQLHAMGGDNGPECALIVDSGSWRLLRRRSLRRLRRPGRPPSAASAALPPFGAAELVRLARVSEPAVSPDGKRVAYVLRITDIDANKGRTTIWLLDIGKRKATPVRLTDLAANSTAPEWSADGRFLYYVSNRSGSSQVWRLAPGSDPTEVTNLPLDVGSFRISPKADRIFVSVEVFRDCPTLACTKQRLDATAHAAEHGVLYDRIFVRHWDTWSDGRRSQLFALALDAAGAASGDPVNLSAGLDGDVPEKPFGGREDFAVSPDGSQVAFSIRAVTVGEPWSTNFDVYLVPASGGTPRNLTADNPAWDGQPAFSPNGTTLAYAAMDRPGYESDRFHLVLLDLASGAKHPLTQHWDRSIRSFAWSRDGKTLFAATDHLGQHPLWAIDAAHGHAPRPSRATATSRRSASALIASCTRRATSPTRPISIRPRTMAAKRSSLRT